MPRIRWVVSLAASALVFESAPLAASSVEPIDAFWIELGSGPDSSPEVAVGASRPAASRTYRLDLARIRQPLLSTPRGSSAVEYGPEITLPLPNGRIERFRVVDAPLLGPSAALSHPDIRTFEAIGTDDATLRARLDLTQLGLRGMIFVGERAALLDPLERGRTDLVTARWIDDGGMEAFECEAIERATSTDRAPLPTTFSAGDQLKTFRFVLMATGEFAEEIGSVPAATAELATLANRIAEILERDAAIRLEIVALHPFEDAETDPYDWSSFVDVLNRNTAVVDSIYGSASYDISQAIVVIGGNLTRGISSTPAVCSEWKGECVVAAYSAVAPFLFLTMGHELGHAIGGATHTQDRACNRSSQTPYEVGSGITIVCSMPAACPPDFQPQRDPYYHAASIDQLIGYWLTIPACGTLTATGNAPPVANAGPDYMIPRGTPYVLTGTGSDADAGDVLTYTWEQLDKSVVSADSLSGPLIRWRLPTTSPERTIPILATVLSGLPDPFERLANSNRTLRFRLLARDNHASAGGVAWDDVFLTVSGEPFTVTSPNGGETIDSANPFPVTWTVGGGAVAASVRIMLSIDGGASWATLLEDTPNDGAEDVTYPSDETSPSCRIKVEAVGSIFFDVSAADFTLTGVTAVSPSPRPLEAFTVRTLGHAPASGDVLVQFELPREMSIDLAVFDAAGRRVDTLASGVWPRGEHRLPWDGGVGAGRTPRPGVYWVRLEGEGAVRVADAVRVR